MKYVYMLQIDWAKDNDGGVMTVLYKNYSDALDAFEDIFERMGEDDGFIVHGCQPSDNIVLFDYNELFDEQGQTNQKYEISEASQDDPEQPNLFYHIKEKNNYGYHLFIDLTKIEVWEETDE